MPQWVEFLERHPGVMSRFEYEVMKLMSEVMAHTITLHLLDAPGRLSRFQRKHPDLAARIPKKELAAYLNLTPETLSPPEAEAGRELSRPGRPRVLIRLFRQVLASLRTDRSKPAFHRELARRYLDAGQWREAAASSRAALELDPADPQDWNRWGSPTRNLASLRRRRNASTARSRLRRARWERCATPLRRAATLDRSRSRSHCSAARARWPRTISTFSAPTCSR